MPVTVGPTIGPGADEGFYLPGPAGTNGDFWLGDIVRVHTGTGPFDFNEVNARVMAITITRDDDNGELIVIPELQEVPTPVVCTIMGYLVGSGNPGTYNVPITNTPSGHRSYLSSYGSAGDDVASDPEGLTFYPFAGLHHRPAPGAWACHSGQGCGGGFYFSNYGFVDATMPDGHADGGALVDPKIEILVVGAGTMTVWATNMPGKTADGDVELWRIAIGNPSDPTDSLNPDVPTLISSVPLVTPSHIVTVPDDGYCLHRILVRDPALNHETVAFGGWDWEPA